MTLRWVVFVLVCVAARPLESLLAVISIVLIVEGEASLIAGAIVVGGLLYWLLRRFVPGFTHAVRSLSSSRRRWSSFCHAAYDSWVTRRIAREDGVDTADFDSKRLDDD